jgi:hypothetical protein
MWCVITGIITCLVCYFIVNRRAGRKGNSLQSEGGVDISNHRHKIERYLQVIRDNRRELLRDDGYDPVFVLMNNWYIRLSEMYRHDEVKQTEVIGDWLRYLGHTNRAMVTHHSWLEMLEKDEQYDREHFAEQERLSVELEEIENRFAGLVNQEAELEGCRLKVAIQREYFDGCVNFNELLTGLYGTPKINDLKKMQKLAEVLEKMKQKGEKITFHPRNKKLISVLKTKLRLK